ncbi:MAG: rhomboid family intramembrane serine protease [Bacteriovoracaceae bacterium]|jgi:membrane associated rhomboid family serine protease|nr:rhomboid family intramembrane serine protease [Bacteriovoracaceae bacterium]
MNQFVLPKLSLINKSIIITTVVLFLLNTILSKSGMSLYQFLGLSSPGFLKGYVWQVLTYPFISTGLLEVVFGCIMIWFIGSELETMWGRKRYCYFLLFTLVGGGLSFLFMNTVFFGAAAVLSGLAGATSALCLAYAIIFPDREFTFMLIFPMKAKYFCGILIAMSLYQGVFSGAGGAVLAWGHLGAMLFGYLYMYLVSHPYFKSITPGGSLSSSKTDSGRRPGRGNDNPWSLGALKKNKKKKGHLSLVGEEDDDGDDDDDPPKYLH